MNELFYVVGVLAPICWCIGMFLKYVARKTRNHNERYVIQDYRDTAFGAALILAAIAAALYFFFVKQGG